MGLDEVKYSAYLKILQEELVPAMGCTEPIAIAYAAAVAGNTLSGAPERIEVELSGNIIKNAKSVYVPNTGGLRGIKGAVAAGIIADCPHKKLEILEEITEKEQKKIAEFLESCPIEVKEADTSRVFEILISVYRGCDRVRVRITDYHTNLVFIEKNSEILLEQSRETSINAVPAAAGDGDKKELLTAEDIITFADTVSIEDVRELIERQIAYNMAIAEEGLRGKYGANIGSVLMQTGREDIRNKAKAMAAAGSDARMSGCSMPVVIISGSGNQGITASVPVVVYGREMKASEEKIIRAVVLSDLMTMYQKSKIGRLSAYCGVISAGCGSGAGIAYLQGGGFKEIAHAVVNGVAILSGTICDGAKSSCAAKIAMAVEAGILGYDMYRNGQEFYAGEGIVTKGIENTLNNIGILATKGMKDTDSEIMKLMLACD
jgi:L-cysteine desulfidase